MKKHELLKHAYDNYPKGTKCSWTKGAISAGNTIISTGVFRFDFEDEYIVDSNGSSVWDGKMWATIVTEDKPKEFEDGRGHIFDNGKWAEIIEEVKHPEFITVYPNSQYPVEVYNDKIRIKCNGSENHKDNLIIRDDELEEIYAAYKSLKYIKS